MDGQEPGEVRPRSLEISGRPEQVSRSAEMRSSTVPTPGLLTRHHLLNVQPHPDSIGRTPINAVLPAKKIGIAERYSDDLHPHRNCCSLIVSELPGERAEALLFSMAALVPAAGHEPDPSPCIL